MSDVAVYGGASGIGKALAYELLAMGENVFVYDLKPGDIEGVTYRQQIFGTDSDLTPAPERWYEVYVTLGRPSARLFETTTIEYEYELMRANFGAVTQALRHAWSSAMRSCAYVLTSSVSAERADPGGTIYAASKAAVEALGRNLAREWRPATVNVVAPGPTATEQFLTNVTNQNQKREADRAPNNAILVPSDVARYMISVARARGVTGQVLTIDHGGTVASRRNQ